MTLVLMAGCNNAQKKTFKEECIKEKCSSGLCYSETARACINEALDYGQRMAAGASVSYVGYIDGIIIESVTKESCEGCYTTILIKNNEKMKASVNNFAVTQVVLV